MASSNNSAPEGNVRWKSFTQSNDEARARFHAAAMQKQHPDKGQDSKRAYLVDKVSQYVPASMSKMLGKDEASTTSPGKSEEPAPPGPPHRPEHDENIGEFLRDTHRSTGISLEK
ncbi:hypothetical protein B0T19DRAFT_460291 [Cercophora scortea]|uniref:Uncharacterized protein n=1 Tax=Cercophora scortea TaxID=314031 RepID=A0AAE0IL79_9PEZI|nr:hypothetical protein B0T19DRAFT_460291 [Cercophora scortea]